VLVKTVLFLLNAALAIAILHLISQVHLPSFVKMQHKYLKDSTFSSCFWSMIIFTGNGCLEILITFFFPHSFPFQSHITMLTIKLMSLFPAPSTAVYTVYQQSTELEIYCGDTDNCGLGSWLLKFLDHTQSVGLLCTSDQSVVQATTYTTHNKHNGRTSMPSGGFDPATTAIKRLQNYNWDGMVMGDRRH